MFHSQSATVKSCRPRHAEVEVSITCSYRVSDVSWHNAVPRILLLTCSWRRHPLLLAARTARQSGALTFIRKPVTALELCSMRVVIYRGREKLFWVLITWLPLAVEKRLIVNSCIILSPKQCETCSIPVRLNIVCRDRPVKIQKPALTVLSLLNCIFMHFI